MIKSDIWNFSLLMLFARYSNRSLSDL